MEHRGVGERGNEPHAFTFRAALRWFTPVWRDIEILESQTLVTLHDAIQRAFVWYDDHLYSFFLSGSEWDKYSEYTKPSEKEESSVFNDVLFSEEAGSADTPLRHFCLRKGQRIAYVYDFGDNISVDLHLKEIAARRRVRYPRIVALQGFTPEQYRYAERRYGPKIKSLTGRRLPIVKVEGGRKKELDLLLRWSDTKERRPMNRGQSKFELMTEDFSGFEPWKGSTRP